MTSNPNLPDQDDLAQIYQSILAVARKLNPQPQSVENLRSRIISHFRYSGVRRFRRYGQTTMHSSQEKSPVTRFVSKRATTAELLKIKDRKEFVLDKIIDRVAEELELTQKPSAVEMEKSLVNMREIVKKMDLVAQEGTSIGSDIAKIPDFIETGKWE